MRTRLALAAVTAALAALPAHVSAHWGNGARIVSGSLQRHEQADAATQFAAVSGDGRYAVFQTRARNLFPNGYAEPPGMYRLGGVFRSDLDTGALELVAFGDLRRVTDDALVTRGALNPSISADGRFIAFSSSYQHVAADTNPNVDVYVRDMAKPIDDPGAFELVSALDGTDTPPPYSAPSGAAGSDLTRGGALSADGRRILFRTTLASTLSGTATPPRQLYVRDRAAKTTALVTRTLAGQPAGGAKDAALSADGSTVAWTGSNAGVQTRLLTGEAPDSNQDFYLWQRFADGPAAPTRRITGPFDPDDPGCPADEVVQPGAEVTGPCYGPLSFYESQIPFNIDGKVPALSADGWRVAFVAAVPARPTNVGNNHDLFLTDMRDGVTRKAGTLELTREGPSTTDQTSSALIENVAISGDGNRVAFTTVRSQFILPTPRLVDDPAIVAPDVLELYLLDLPSMTIQRVTRAYDGAEPDNGVVGGVSISGDGRRVAFVSGASNLVIGDANQQPDAFVASQPGTGAGGGVGEPPFVESSTPPAAGGARRPRLTVRVSRAHGRLRLSVKAPGPGRLTVTARGRLGTTRKRARTIAVKRVRTAANGRASVVLVPARRYRATVRRDGRVRVRLVLKFTSASGLRLTAWRVAAFTS